MLYDAREALDTKMIPSTHTRTPPPRGAVVLWGSHFGLAVKKVEVNHLSLLNVALLYHI